jgi:hypothetical protein
MKGISWALIKLNLNEFCLFCEYWDKSNAETKYNSFEEFLHDSIIFDETKEGFEYWNEISKRV